MATQPATQYIVVQLLPVLMIFIVMIDFLHWLVYRALFQLVGLEQHVGYCIMYASCPTWNDLQCDD